MSLTNSHREQWDRMHDLAFDQLADIELRIRSAASHVIGYDTTYTAGGTVIPWAGGARLANSAAVPDYCDIHVSLYIGLRDHPKEAQLIAEDIIREQLYKYGLVPASKAHTISNVKFEDYNDPDVPEECLDRYPVAMQCERVMRLRCRLDNMIVESVFRTPRWRASQMHHSEDFVQFHKRKLTLDTLTLIAKKLDMPGFEEE